MNNKTSFLTAITAATLLASSTTAMSADKVTIAEFKYTSAQATLHVMKNILEKRLGLEVATLTGNNAVFYAAMDRGKGEADFHVEVWLPNQKALVQKYANEKKSIVVSKNPYSATSGFCVPRYFAKATNNT